MLLNFCQISHPISISLSPNTEKDDILLALKLIFKPQIWKKGKEIEKLEEEFKSYLGVKYTFSFNSGRSALMAILEALNINKGDEVLLQAFTCNAAVNPILWAGLKPIYIDCNEKTFNIDIEDLKRKISPKSRVVMVQHTFGLAADLDEILEICQEHNLILIEDCAHSLGATYKGKKTGTFGQAAFFSFGRDKIISSVFGGMAVTNNDQIGERIKNFQDKLDSPSYFWVFQQLLHPILMNYLIIPAYGINQNLGRVLLGIFHKLSILSKAVYKKEKMGEVSKCFPKRLPNALAILALNQFKKLERFNEHRREIAKFYDKNLKDFGFILSEKNAERVYMRYSLLMKNKETDKILKEARKRKIFLDDSWRKSPICPPDTSLEKMEYKKRSCPQAEKLAKKIINLPTHINISKKDAKRIVDFLKGEI